MQSSPLLTVKQFAQKNPAFSESSMRSLIFNSRERISSRGIIPSNGLHIALVYLGRRVLIDPDLFFEWLMSQQEHAESVSN